MSGFVVEYIHLPPGSLPPCSSTCTPSHGFALLPDLILLNVLMPQSSPSRDDEEFRIVCSHGFPIVEINYIGLPFFVVFPYFHTKDDGHAQDFPKGF